jgi:hypothetical protein
VDGSAALDAATIVGLLADSDRRRVLAAVELGAASMDDVIARTGLGAAALAKAMGKLVESGLVASGDHGLRVESAAFVAAARAARTRPVSTEHDGVPAERRRVLDAFVRDGRLTSIPTVLAKRLVVLDWLAQDFDPGVRYSERQVNLVLGKRHADMAALRRYLVDHGFLDREAGVYWRTGGSVPEP